MLADLNHDGVVDGQDARVAFSALGAVLSQGLPSAAGFFTGFSLGVKSSW